MTDKVGSVLVVGGGIAGVQASLDLADSGFRVYLLDKSPGIGGVMAQLDKTFPTNDCSMCILAPKLVAAGRHPNIHLITNADVTGIKGEAGNFTVDIKRKARYVIREKCTGCGLCAEKCPVEAIDDFNQGFSARGSIYVKYAQTVPLTFIIDRDKCIGCGTCQEVCRAKAVNYEDTDEEVLLNVGSLILSPGFEEFDPHLKSEYGYGRYPNVVSSIDFERILSASGPYGGVVLRTSDGEVPRRIAFLQCVGSRDAQIGNNYCSAACCMYGIKEAVIAKEHTAGVQCTIFFMDIRSYGKDFELYYNRAQEEYGVRFVRSRVASIEEIPGSKNLKVKYVEGEQPKEEEFDLVVLSVGMQPPKGAKELAKALDIKLNNNGFCYTSEFSPVETSRKGIYVCGAFQGPKDIPESVSQASGAAMKAASDISSERWKLTTTKEYAPEVDVSQEEPRIGVFVCHCGINIGGIVKVPEVVEYARKLSNVVYAEQNLYTCSQDTQEKIRDKIKEFKLNRVIVASCTPRTHEPLFRETVREAGLNIYLFEMANIRDQCSWVHMHEPTEATEKAKDLVRSIVAKARLLEPLTKPIINVTPTALIIGGGLSGMTAALDLANQSFQVNIVEKEKNLGGHLRHIYSTLGSEDPQKKLGSIIKEVSENPNIHVYLNSTIDNIDGYVGNFKTKLQCDGRNTEVESGAIIVSTGAIEYTPKEYFYGVNNKVITQRELEEKISKGQLDAKGVVMVQCVGSRNEENPNCSRICCSQAIKNSLKIKELSPETEVYILYKDIRTYGFMEEAYREASAKGVICIRYDDEKTNINAVNEDGALKISVLEPILNAWVQLEPDLLVLSTATIANPDNEKLAKMLKVPLSKNKFFLEAHMKLRPVDFATEGIFLCGLAHSPKLIEESLAQASAAASRAATILSKKTLEVEGAISKVDEDLCSGCKVCEHLCEYNAIEMRDVDGKKRAHVLEALCKGCGVCGGACPTGAITMQNFTDNQIMAQIKAALMEEQKA